MVKPVCLSACFCFLALCPVAAYRTEIEAVFTNRSLRTFELEIFDARGLAASSTLEPGTGTTITVADGEARIYKPSRELSWGKPVSSCKIITKHAHGSHAQLHFEIRGSKIVELASHP